MLCPILQNLCGQSSLSLNDLSVVEGMNKNCVVLFFILSGLCDSIIESSSCEDDFEPLSSEPLYTFNFEFWSDGRHENGTLDLESMAAVGDTLSMVTSTCGDDTSFFLLLSKAPESIGGSPDFKASNGLHILTFEIDFGVVLFGEVLGFNERSVHNDSFTFPIRLVDGICRNEFGLMFSINLSDSVCLRVHDRYLQRLSSKIYL
jgi:hypothetical protein